MDYIEGETLEEYLNKTPDDYLPLPEALDVGVQLCDVLDYLHTRQPPIIFRDLKPLNIMRTSSGHLYLIDFGIARHFKPGQAKDTVAFGSPGYAAPEQYGKTQTTPRSDIYSLGATLYQMLTGNDPSLNPFRFAPLHLPAGKPTPASLATLLASMLDMDEARRPASMGAVKTELQAIAAQVASGSFSSVVPATPVSAVSSTSVPASQPSSIGKLRCMHRGLQQGVNSLAWSPDNTLLASAGAGNSVEIWDATDGKSVRSCSNHIGNIRAIAWSPNGKYIASAGEDKTVQVCECASGKIVQVYKGHSHIVTSISWSPDSRCLASSSIDRSVQVWDMQTGYTYVNYSRHEDVVYRAAWSPDGKYIASDGYAPVVHVWEAMSGRQFLTYRGHSALILALGWSPDSQRLASGSYDTTVRVWEALSGRPIATYNGHTGEVHALSWSPDGAHLVSCSSESIVPIWNANTGQEIFVYRGHDLQPELQPVQTTLYSSSGYPLPADKQFYQFVARAVGVNAVAWSPDGQWIASAGADNIIHVWQAS